MCVIYIFKIKGAVLCGRRANTITRGGETIFIKVYSGSSGCIYEWFARITHDIHGLWAMRIYESQLCELEKNGDITLSSVN